jgi:hypothetical protein
VINRLPVVCHTHLVTADVFRPQSAGRAVRTAFVLGVLIVVAIVAAGAAIDNFSALLGDNTKDELTRYFDDNQHTTARPHGAGFKVDFPVPPSRQSERVATGAGTVDAPRDAALVDDEITFDVVWLDLRGVLPAQPDARLTSLIKRQVRQLSGTRVALSAKKPVGHAIARDFVVVNVDQSGVKRFFDEQIVLAGRHVWILRVGSRIRRDEAFRRFTASFALTG